MSHFLTSPVPRPGTGQTKSHNLSNSTSWAEMAIFEFSSGPVPGTGGRAEFPAPRSAHLEFRLHNGELLSGGGGGAGSRLAGGRLHRGFQVA